jgi:hypothetical protein
METEARVTECHYELSRTDPLTLGIAKHSNQVIISFTYYAHARTYYDSLASSVASATGESFSVYYNDLNPSQSTQSASDSVNRTRNRKLPNVVLKSVAGQQTTGDVIQPWALADLMKSLGHFHRFPPAQKRAALLRPTMIESNK